MFSLQAFLNIPASPKQAFLNAAAGTLENAVYMSRSTRVKRIRGYRTRVIGLGSRYFDRTSATTDVVTVVMPTRWRRLQAYLSNSPTVFATLSHVGWYYVYYARETWTLDYRTGIIYVHTDEAEALPPVKRLQALPAWHPVKKGDVVPGTPSSSWPSGSWERFLTKISEQY